MEETMLLLDCKVTARDGKRFDFDEFFKLLSDNGYTIEGSVDKISKDELEEEIEDIKSDMTDEKIENMIKDVMEFYDIKSPFDTYDFFNMNYGTAAFTGVFERYLSKETMLKFKKLSSQWWEISDYVQSALGDVVCEYIDSHYSN